MGVLVLFGLSFLFILLGSHTLQLEWEKLVVAVFPYLAAIAVAIARGRWFYKRTMSRPDVNVCLHCGYDLRASINRCPECGNEIPLILRNSTESRPKQS